MRPLNYHDGQRAVQDEANTRHVADKLAGWVGPAGDYAVAADMVVLALGDALQFGAISGAPPLVTVTGPGRLALPAIADGLVAGSTGVLPAGGLVISLERAERARINGLLEPPLSDTGLVELVASEAFTLCRKYMAPSVATRTGLIAGPAARESVPLEDPWIAQVVGAAETAFLATIAPGGSPDVAHRGGPPGFLAFDPQHGCIAWSEYVGDGVFKSAGNVRATGTAVLLVLDLQTGDAIELAGDATYTNTLTRFRPREEPLVRLPDAFPQQGRLELRIRASLRLHAFTHPRARLDTLRVTSRDTEDEQAPR